MLQDDLDRSARILDGTVNVWEIISYLQSDSFLTKASAVRFIDHKSDKPIEAAIRTGELRAYRIGKKTLVKKSELQAWVEAHEVTPQTRQEAKTDLQKLVNRAVDAARRKTG